MDKHKVNKSEIISGAKFTLISGGTNFVDFPEDDDVSDFLTEQQGDDSSY